MSGIIGVLALCLMFGLAVCFAIMYVREVIKLKAFDKKYRTEVKEQRVDAVKKSRSVIEGEVFERLVTHFKEWKYGDSSDARFLASPLDYVVFSGLAKNNVKEIIFVEIKTGNSRTTKRQRSVKKAIENGNVRYELLRIGEGEELDEKYE